VRVAVGYERDGRPVQGFPASARELERCVPVYERFPGWQTPTVEARSWRELPPNARAYLERMARGSATKRWWRLRLADP